MHGAQIRIATDNIFSLTGHRTLDKLVIIWIVLDNGKGFGWLNPNGKLLEAFDGRGNLLIGELMFAADVWALQNLLVLSKDRCGDKQGKFVFFPGFNNA